MTADKVFDLPDTEGPVPAEIGQDNIDQVLELRRCGAEVKQVTIPSDGSTVRFKILMPTPSFPVRTLLEKAGYDVGASMNGENLGFYATKRSLPSKGWSD